MFKSELSHTCALVVDFGDLITKIYQSHWMLKRCDLAFMRLVRRMRSQGMLRGAVDVAIDFHNIGRYDKHPDMKFMRKSKYKNGTCNFNVFATVHCVVDGSRLCLGAILRHDP